MQIERDKESTNENRRKNPTLICQQFVRKLLTPNAIKPGCFGQEQNTKKTLLCNY